MANPSFPLVKANLLLPPDGREGSIAVCTNTLAPGMVYNEIEPRNRPHISVLGSLVVNRDGTERMILNTLVHQRVQTLVSFGADSHTFSPSLNLLSAIMQGYKPDRTGHYIERGVGASPHYPNISPEHLELFRNNITVLPLFTSARKSHEDTIRAYLDWLSVQSDQKAVVANFIRRVYKKCGSKIYYDKLNELINEVTANDRPKIKVVPELDSKDFQQLQPPVVEAEPYRELPEVPFSVWYKDGVLEVEVRIGGSSHHLFVSGEDEFQVAYTLVKQIKELKKYFTPHEQLLLGAEIARAMIKGVDELETEPYSTQMEPGSAEYLPPVALRGLKTDKQYYYRVGVEDDQLSVQCMSYDTCDDVFDLRSTHASDILYQLAELNRFEDYELDMLHRMDVGMQCARAEAALRHGKVFMQDLDRLVSLNTTDLPLVYTEGGTFLGAHKALLGDVYTRGLTEPHADTQKGLGRTAIVLAVFRNAGYAFGTMPRVYQQGDASPDQMRADYKAQLLRFDHDGSYSYGQRTREYFGVDQLEQAAEALDSHPNVPCIIQRFDPVVDMGHTVDADTGNEKYTHDPCLTHDIYFIAADGRLHGVHIARAHNLVNAYPENMYGLQDAYTASIATSLGVEVGDEVMLSSRANVLLLTEEQRLKTLLAEPSKPYGDMFSPHTIGPINLSSMSEEPPEHPAIFYEHVDIVKTERKPAHPFLGRLTNIGGINTVERAIDYLEKRGANHNNPVLSTYDARIDNPQSAQLVFFQANVMGGKLHATAVFANRTSDDQQADQELCHYLATQYASRLGVPLGKLMYMRVG